MKSEKQKKKLEDPNWMSGGDFAYVGNQWVGALFFYIFRIDRSKPFAYYSEKRFKTRNIILGYVLGIILFIGLLLLIFRSSIPH